MPLLPLWAFVACYRVNFTFTHLLKLYHQKSAKSTLLGRIVEVNTAAGIPPRNTPIEGNLTEIDLHNIIIIINYNIKTAASVV
jgi:hypothetical protein